MKNKSNPVDLFRLAKIKNEACGPRLFYFLWHVITQSFLVAHL